MSENLAITEKGKQVVASLEFAENLRECLAAMHADGVPDDVGIAAAASLTAWALTGHDINRPPKTDDELEALALFCDSHAAEVDAAGDVLTANLLKMGAMEADVDRTPRCEFHANNLYLCKNPATVLMQGTRGGYLHVCAHHEGFLRDALVHEMVRPSIIDEMIGRQLIN